MQAHLLGNSIEMKRGIWGAEDSFLFLTAYEGMMNSHTFTATIFTVAPLTLQSRINTGPPALIFARVHHLLFK